MKFLSSFLHVSVHLKAVSVREKNAADSKVTAVLQKEKLEIHSL